MESTYRACNVRSVTRGAGDRIARRIALVLSVAGLAALAPGSGWGVRPAEAATYLVTNTTDAAAGSLRDAINSANANAGTDSVHFAIPNGDPGHDVGLGVWRIAPLTILPTITEALILDASTQPGWIGTPVVELDCAGAVGATAGILIHADDCLVRGFIVHSSADEGIEIAGDTGYGDFNVIENCWVGLRPDRTPAPNSEYGIMLTNSARANRIGGTGPFDGNVIGASPLSSIVIRNSSSNDNVVIGNRIGVGPDGLTPRGGQQHGIEIHDDAQRNRIGGATAAEANVIAYHLLDGVRIASNAGEGNEVLRNSIYANQGLGIDLEGDGVTANDGALSSTTTNQRIDHPVLTTAVIGPSNLRVGGFIGIGSGQAVFAGARVEVFRAAVDPSGFGEGRTFVGALTADANGRFSGALPSAGLVAGDTLTATATLAPAGTSEFGPALRVDALRVTKRAFLADGTPLISGAVLPRGTLVRFLLYVSNAGGLVPDLGVRDSLATGFQYLPGSLHVDASQPDCPGGTCDAAREAAIYAAAALAAIRTDGVDADVASFGAGIVRAGDREVANARLDAPAARVWALLFSVRVQ
ncbi:MAG: hypothetical protein HOP12_07565 [Candidatus Eisenbacteria bacterium]|uniref:Right-handed parallel beta-helix repeat-containing protein n=1 Tax=Eiseniibacteriota bacterium TaxID=2212470 RepID=A0A849SHT6_UNCEI|nr:hypothetical protein [Candidatus Eisenbacteria bacterium]